MFGEVGGGDVWERCGATNIRAGWQGWGRWVGAVRCDENKGFAKGRLAGVEGGGWERCGATQIRVSLGAGWQG